MKTDSARRDFLRTGACALGALLMTQESPRRAARLRGAVPKTGKRSRGRPGHLAGVRRRFRCEGEGAGPETLKMFVELGGRVIDSCAQCTAPPNSVTGELAAALASRPSFSSATKVWTSAGRRHPSDGGLDEKASRGAPRPDAGAQPSGTRPRISRRCANGKMPAASAISA